MSSISVIGLDIAKNIFQVHAIDEAGEIVENRQIRRNRLMEYFKQVPACLIGIEAACATAHYWGRELRALGHELRLIPPQL